MNAANYLISLMCAIEHIEANLTNEVNVGGTAMAAYVSPSQLQRMFAAVFRCSVGEYIVKRKLCQAAEALLRTDKAVTELALEYGYGSTESFSRAFRRQFRKAPSTFRRESRFTELYPKLLLNENNLKGWIHMIKQYDITEVSAKILAAKGTYIIRTDIDCMMKINEISHDAGDAALAETAARIEKHLPADGIFFRTGGDEFIILTSATDLVNAEHIAAGVISHANEDVAWKGGTFRFTLSLGISQIPADITDAQAVLARADEAMYEAKKNGRNTFAVN